jgi:Holliday junction resolvase RusA-like endonuclease
MYTTSMGVIDLCDDGVDSYDGDVNGGVEFGLLDVAVVQTAAANRSRSGAGGAGTDADIQVPKRVHSWPLGVVVQTAGSDTQPPKRARGRPRKLPQKMSRFGEVACALFKSTSTEIYFEVNGKPAPKQRAAFGRNGNRYNPSKLEEQQFAEVVVSLCRRNVHSVPIFSSGVLLAVQITFYFPLKKDCASLCNEADIDNLCKFVFDALNGILYADDRQIVEVTAAKRFDAISRTTVQITTELQSV